MTPKGVATPRGPYSPGVKCGDFIYVSGQIPVDPETNKPVTGDIKAETRQVLENVKRVLEGCGATIADVVKCNVYLVDVTDFAAMNEVYSEYFGEAKPARTTVAVAALPLPGAKVEIDCIAYKE
ncbi:MAG TPA: Rid family detoxifying hydrolase [Candidatus Limnocylindrales bacterium]|nr:Rid family detoxifying hydrolase [Candidatus Limnocylindrales bacterium]